MAHMHAGYSPAEAKRLARQIDAAAERDQRTAYAEYAAESRACGYEVVPFDEWSGKTTAKAKASERMARIPWSDLDMY